MRFFKIFLQSFLLTVVLHSGSAFAGEKLLGQALDEILKICQERIDHNNELLKERFKVYSITKRSDDKSYLDAIVLDILTFKKLKNKLETILKIEDVLERDRLVDDLREALRRNYINEKSMYNRKTIKIAEGPYFKRMFELLGPFISTTQKRLEAILLAYTIQKKSQNFLIYELDMLARLDRLREKAILVLNNIKIVPESLKKSISEWVELRDRFLNPTEENGGDYEMFYTLLHRIFSLEDDIDSAWIEFENAEEFQEKEQEFHPSVECSHEEEKSEEPIFSTSCPEQKLLGPSKEQRKLDSVARTLKSAFVKKKDVTNPGTLALAVEYLPQGQSRLVVATKKKVSSKELSEALTLVSNWIAEWNKFEGVSSFVVENNAKLKWVLNKLKNSDPDNRELSLMRLYYDVRSDVDTAKLAIYLASKNDKSQIQSALKSAIYSKKFLLLDNDQELHPELAIAEYFVNSKSSQKEVYIGINILNCRKCFTIFEGETNSKNSIRIVGINENSGICFKRRGKYELGYPNTVLPNCCLNANPNMKPIEIRDRLDSLCVRARIYRSADIFIVQNAELSDSDGDAFEAESEMIRANRESIASINQILFKRKKYKAVVRLVDGDGECGFSSLRKSRVEFVRDVSRVYKSGSNVRLNKLMNAILGRRNIDQWAAWYVNSGEWMTEDYLHIFSTLYNTEIFVYTADTADGGVFVPLLGQGGHIDETNGTPTNVVHLLSSSYAPLSANGPVTAFNHYDEIIIGEFIPQIVNTNGLVLDADQILNTHNTNLDLHFDL